MFSMLNIVSIQTRRIIKLYNYYEDAFEELKNIIIEFIGEEVDKNK